MNSIRLLCAAVASAPFLLASAQGPITAAKPAVSATSLQLEYRSAFDGYRAYQEPVARSWRETNDEAGALGGHRGQLKPRSMPPDAAGKAGEPAPRSLAPAKPAARGHEDMANDD